MSAVPYRWQVYVERQGEHPAVEFLELPIGRLYRTERTVFANFPGHREALFDGWSDPVYVPEGGW